MVFGLFRKSEPSPRPLEAPVQLPTPTPSIESALVATDPVAQSSSSGSPSQKPPSSAKPSPTRPHFAVADLAAPPPDPDTQADALITLLAAVPAKTLHAYTLSHIRNAPPPALAALAAFFATLAPPPRLHCVRCHKDYVEVENDDRACLVPHDDDSAVVERVGMNHRSRGARGIVSEGTTYETIWGCCDKVVEGDGDRGPPDGWCYEGKHTTDMRRARFRADATPHDDKLISCLARNCHRILVQLAAGNASPSTGTSARKRARSTRSRKSMNLKEDSSSDVEMVDAEPAAETASATGSMRGRGRGRGRPPLKLKKKDDEDEDKDKADDDDAASVVSTRSAKEPKKPRRTASRPPASKGRARSQGPPARRGRPKKNATTDAEESGVETAKEDKGEEAPKPKKKRKVA